MNEILLTRFSDKTREDFTMRNPWFNADRETEYAMQPVRCVTGNAPTLQEVDDRFGRNAASEWIVPLLADLSIFTGAKNLGARQQKQLASIIAAEQRGLKVTEVMLFFYRFKTGRYGRFYGAVDPMVVTTALQDFLRERQEIIDSEQDRRADEWRKEAESRWPACQADIAKATGLRAGTDIYLFNCEPYSRRLLLGLGSREVADRLVQPDVWQQYRQAVLRHYPETSATVIVRLVDKVVEPP